MDFGEIKDTKTELLRKHVEKSINELTLCLELQKKILRNLKGFL